MLVLSVFTSSSCSCWALLPLLFQPHPHWSSLSSSTPPAFAGSPPLIVSDPTPLLVHSVLSPAPAFAGPSSPHYFCPHLPCWSSLSSAVLPALAGPSSPYCFCLPPIGPPCLQQFFLRLLDPPPLIVSVSPPVGPLCLQQFLLLLLIPPPLIVSVSPPCWFSLSSPVPPAFAGPSSPYCFCLPSCWSSLSSAVPPALAEPSSPYCFCLPPVGFPCLQQFLLLLLSPPPLIVSVSPPCWSSLSSAVPPALADPSSPYCFCLPPLLVLSVFTSFSCSCWTLHPLLFLSPPPVGPLCLQQFLLLLLIPPPLIVSVSPLLVFPVFSSSSCSC